MKATKYRDPPYYAIVGIDTEFIQLLNPIESDEQAVAYFVEFLIEHADEPDYFGYVLGHCDADEKVRWVKTAYAACREHYQRIDDEIAANCAAELAALPALLKADEEYEEDFWRMADQANAKWGKIK